MNQDFRGGILEQCAGAITDCIRGTGLEIGNTTIGFLVEYLTISLGERIMLEKGAGVPFNWDWGEANKVKKVNGPLSQCYAVST